MMDTTDGGMAAHARMLRVAVLRSGAARPTEWEVANEPRAVKRLAQRVRREAEAPVMAWYEAGPTGLALQRRREAADVGWQGIAPALIPSRPGDRGKTDRRAARQLPELLRAELLTVGQPPTLEPEAGRVLCRARSDAATERPRARPGWRSGGRASPTTGATGRRATPAGC